MKRIQLTLFLNKKECTIFENIREKYNPIQRELIDCHVTLCREDELLDMNYIRNNLQNLKFEPICLYFGKPQRFLDGKGVLLPVIGKAELFQTLRKILLKGVIENPRKLSPHITLMHPRNSTCIDAIFQEIKRILIPSYQVLDKISLIQQLNGKKWELLEEFDLNLN